MRRPVSQTSNTQVVSRRSQGPIQRSFATHFKPDATSCNGWSNKNTLKKCSKGPMGKRVVPGDQKFCLLLRKSTSVFKKFLKQKVKANMWRYLSLFLLLFNFKGHLLKSYIPNIFIFFTE